jgi:hypothetical protein
MNAEEIERHVSTEDKIATILPKLLNVHSIKGGREWQLFDKLKDQFPGVKDARRRAASRSVSRRGRR